MLASVADGDADRHASTATSAACRASSSTAPTGIAQAAEHLISLGHRDIVYVSGPETSWANEAGGVRCRHAMAAARTCPRRKIGPFRASRPSGSAAADALLNTGATACIAFNDLLAIGMLTRLRERGVEVPDDISIVGCDDIFGADFCHPPLTTLDGADRAGGPGRGVDAARRAWRIRQSARTRQSVLLPTHLTVRQSSGPAPVPARVSVPAQPLGPSRRS